MNPFWVAWLVPGMENWIGVVAILAVWIVLQVWVLPKLGVPT